MDILAVMMCKLSWFDYYPVYACTKHNIIYPNYAWLLCHLKKVKTILSSSQTIMESTMPGKGGNVSMKQHLLHKSVLTGALLLEHSPCVWHQAILCSFSPQWRNRVLSFSHGKQWVLPMLFLNREHCKCAGQLEIDLNPQYPCRYTHRT